MVSKYLSSNSSCAAPWLGYHHTLGKADRPDLGEKLLLAAGWIAIVAGPMVFAVMFGPQVRAQSAPTTASPTPSFEVASIKPYKPISPGTVIVWPRILPGRFVYTGVTAKRLVAFAYQVRETQVLGGPSWIDMDRYDIDAKEDEADATALQKLPRFQQGEQVGLRMQALLAERFKLMVHHETKELPVYALVVAKNGPKFHESKPNAASPDGRIRPTGHAQPGSSTGGEPEGDTNIFATGTSMALFAKHLSADVGRTVLDETGLKGEYDLRLVYSPDQTQPAIFDGTTEGDAPPESRGPSIFTALREQLGLKLESTKGPVDVIMIDHIERPSAN